MNLELKGHQVDLARDGKEALAKLRGARWDLVVLDVRLPEVSGFDILQKLRAEGDFTPVLMLTARSQPDDVIFGLKSGADGYVVKPFDLAELLARIEGLLRRQEWSRQGGTGEGERGQRRAFGDYWVDFDTYEAKTREGVVQLSQKELAVLRAFLSRPGEVITRRELLAEVWQLPNHPNERVVDNVIVALRQAFEEDSARPRHILSVRGVGYRFVP